MAFTGSFLSCYVGSCRIAATYPEFNQCKRTNTWNRLWVCRFRFRVTILEVTTRHVLLTIIIHAKHETSRCPPLLKKHGLFSFYCVSYLPCGLHRGSVCDSSSFYLHLVSMYRQLSKVFIAAEICSYSYENISSCPKQKTFCDPPTVKVMASYNSWAGDDYWIADTTRLPQNLNTGLDWALILGVRYIATSPPLSMN